MAAALVLSGRPADTIGLLADLVNPEQAAPNCSMRPTANARRCTSAKYWVHKNQQETERPPNGARLLLADSKYGPIGGMLSEWSATLSRAPQVTVESNSSQTALHYADLVDNAIKHGRERGLVSISTDCD